MSLYTWLNKLRNKARRSRSKPSRRASTFRPALELLEDRLVMDTRIWTGGSVFSNHWSDHFNWSNGALFDDPVKPGDSVDFPADASQRTNVLDYPEPGGSFLGGPIAFFGGALVIDNLHIEGGDYDISDHNGEDIGFIGKLSSDSDNNTIRNFLFYFGNQLDNDPATIDVASGSLTLTGGLTSETNPEAGVSFSPVDLIKTGAGTLRVSAPIGDRIPTDIFPAGDDARFASFRVQQGVVSLDDGGELDVDLHVENGGTVRLQTGGDHIFGPVGRSPQVALVTVDAGGLIDLGIHSAGLGNLTLNGGKVTSTSVGALNLESDLTTTVSATAAEIDGRVNLGASRTFTVANGTAQDDLIIKGVIAGAGFGLTKNGSGQLTLSGANNNTYTGDTIVNGGILKLAKTLGARAVSGQLTIGNGGGGTNADRVILFGDEEISNTITPRVNSSGQLALNGNTQTLGGLTLAGGNVSSGTFGLLKLSGDVTTESASRDSTISGHLSLANASSTPRVFNVASALSDLLVSAVIEDGGLNKTGPGTMELTATSPYSGDTTINQGTLRVNGTLSDSLVRLTGGALTGNGTVDGINATDGRIAPGDGVGTLTSTASVTLQSAASFVPQVNPLSGDPHDVLKVQGKVNLDGASLAVQPTFVTSVTSSTPRVIDDGDAGFTATSGFRGGFTGGFNNDVLQGDAGTGAEKATWTFNNLTPGSYRVSATWSASQFRTTNAPYTIVKGGTFTPASTVRVNQQIAPADFTALGASWNILGVVQVTGTSLTVQLTNDCDGAVIADAILLDPHQVVIISNDSNLPVNGTFAGLPRDGTQLSVIASNGTQKQTQIYAISYHANDGNDVGLAYVTTSTAAENLQLTPSSINEGQQTTLTGHLTDPDIGDFLTLTINWGDGHTETHHPGTDNFQFTHRYADNLLGQPHGAFTVHLTWFDQHGAGNSRDLSVTVNNVAPAIVLPAEIDVRTSGLLVLAGHFTDPGVNDRWTATVDYGDGTGVQPLNLNPAQRFLLQHRYERPGTYRVTVTITDDDGEAGIVTLLVHVDALPPHPHP